MTSIVPVGGRAVSGDADGGLQVLAPGISLPFADGRYIKRYVGGELAGDTAEFTNSTGTESVLYNPNGPVMGAVPADAAAVLLLAGDGVRAHQRVTAYRINGTPVFRGVRFNGTYQVPTPLLLASTLAQMTGEGLASDSSTVAISGIVRILSREALTPTAAGGQVQLAVCDVGSATIKNILTAQGGGSGIGEWVCNQTTLRVIPSTNAQLRLPNNTGSQFEWNSTGIGFYGTAPIAKPTVTGSRGGNAALASALTQLAALGILTDGSTA